MSTFLRVPNASDPVDTAPFVLYRDGATSWQMSFGSDANSDPIVQLVDDASGSGPSFTLSGSGGGYHLYQLVYDPDSQTADLLVDGVEVFSLSNHVGFSNSTKSVAWGVGGSSATGRGHFASVNWDIRNHEHTGAQDPTTEGWTFRQTLGGIGDTNHGAILDGGIDAWFVEDTAPSGGAVEVYEQIPTDRQVADGELFGWTLSTFLRVPNVSDPVDTAPFVLYRDGTTSWQMGFAAEGDLDPIVKLVDNENGSGPSFTLSGSGGGYHLYQLVYDPGSQTADLFVDGVEVVSDYVGFSNSTKSVSWGVGSSSGTGRGHFASVNWNIRDQEHTGAQDPTTEGWTFRQTLGGVGDTSHGAIVDGGIDAWFVEDTASSSPAVEVYEQIPTDRQIADGELFGWTLSTFLRVPNASDPVDTAPFVLYRDGATSWQMSFGSDANSDPIVQLVDDASGSGPSFTLSGSGGGYHLYQLVYDPDSQTADLLVDGVEVFSLSNHVGFSNSTKSVAWGVGGSSATGRGHFASVNWDIHDHASGTIINDDFAPIADAGGPYTGFIGEPIQLDGSRTSDLDDSNTSLLFEWDLDYDGTFNVDATGEQPVTLNASIAPRTVALRVTDSDGHVDVASTPYVPRLYWQGDVDQNWSTAANWNTAPDGTGTDAVPVSGQVSLLFDTNTTGFTDPNSVNDLTGLTDITVEIVDTSSSVDFSISGNQLGLMTGSTMRHHQTSGAATIFSVPLTIDGNTLQIDSGTLALSGIVNGTMLTKTGLGELLLTESNVYQGDNDIQSGSVRITHNGGLGDQNGTTTVAAGAVLELDSDGLVLSEKYLTLAGTLRSNASSVWNGDTLTLAGGTIDSVAGELAMQGFVTGSGGFTKVGNGTLTLFGNADYTGLTSVTDGNVRIADHRSLGDVGAGNGTTIADGAALELADPVAGELWTSAISEPLTLTGNGGGTGALTLSVVLDGPFPLTGPINLDGDTTIFGPRAGATLFLNGDITTDGFTLTVDGLQQTQINGIVDGGGAVTKSGSGSLGGNGTIIDPLAILGGSVAPGANPGILNTGSLSFGDGTTLDLEIGGIPPGPSSNSHDQLNVTGTVTIGNNVALNVTALGGFVPTTGNAFVIVNNDGSDAVAGTFAGSPDNSVFLFQNRILQIDYQGGDGNDIELTAVDEFAEYEPNDLTAQAIPIVAGADPITVHGNIDLLGDRDWYQFTLDTNAGVYFDIDAEDIGLSNLDAKVLVCSEDFVTCGANIDGYDFDGFSPNDEEETRESPDPSLYMDLGPGDYFVRVDGRVINTFTTGSYELKVYADTNYSATVPVLNSDPGAPDTLYLDFTGHSSSTDCWATCDFEEAGVQAHGPYAIPPFDVDGNAAGYSPAERKTIENVWRVVSEDFSIFNVNVTTVEPSAFNDGQAYRIVIGGDGSEFGHGGGVLGAAILDSYAEDGAFNNVGFTFAENFPSQIMAQALEMGNTTSHEFGHALSLRHFGGGNAQPNAIMHTPDFGVSRERWKVGKTHDGESSPDQDQNGVQVIGNGTGLRADDHGNSMATATTLSSVGSGDFQASGILNTTADRDFFRFSSSGDATIIVVVDEYIANVDTELRLYNSAGQLLATDDPSPELGARVNLDLAFGEYFVEVASDGGDGEVGQYSVFVETSPDGDIDGVGDDVENGAPNKGDGNDDGLLDSDQDNVASLPNAQNGNYVTVVSATGSTLANVAAISNPSPSNTPANVVFPVGFLDYQVQDVVPGSATAVTLVAPLGTTFNTYYKYGPTTQNTNPQWYEFLYDAAGCASDPSDTLACTGAEINGNVITLHFIDGERGDDDLAADGVIVDPGAPARDEGPDDPPVLTNNPATVLTGGVLTITESLLTADDPDTNLGALVYQVTSFPSSGQLLLAGNPLGQAGSELPNGDVHADLQFISSFTQLDILGGVLSYQHDGSATTNDTFAFQLSDGTTTLPVATFQITVNSAPLIDDQSFAIDENSDNTSVVGTAMATDPDLPGDALTWSITGGNAGGAFAINSTNAQITVANKAALDFETTPVFQLTVQVEDSFGETDNATITINLNDLEATLSIDDVSVVEGDSGTATLGFTISVAGDAVNVPFAVKYDTADGSAVEAGTGTGDDDYSAANGTAHFDGSTGQIHTVNVTVNGGTVVELTETLSVVLSGLVGTNDVTIADGTGQGTIINDDSATLSIADAIVLEGDVAGDNRQLQFDVTLDTPLEVDLKVDFQTQNGAAEDENGDADYQSSSGTLTIAAGELTGQIIVDVNEDLKVESDETLEVVLSNPQAGGLHVQAASAVSQHQGAADPTTEGWTHQIVSAGSGTSSGPLADDLGFDAWFVEDTSNSSNDYYSQPASDADISQGNTFGWRLSARLRVPDSSDPLDASPFVLYRDGSRSWQMHFASEPDGDPIVQLFENPGGATHTLQGAGPGYHLYELVYDSSLLSADLFVDGVEVLSDYTAFSNPNKAVEWGTGGSLATGRGHFNLVEWTTTERAVGTIINDDFAPVASAGGPYVIDEGDDLTLNASASTDADDGFSSLTFLWDVDGDGDFDENVTGETPALTAAEMAALGLEDGPNSSSITVEVSDGTNFDTATATLTINNVDPTANEDLATVSEEGSAIIINVLDNDIDPAGVSDPLTVSSVGTTGTIGLVGLAAHIVTYDPNSQFESLAAGETTTDTFNYSITDGDGGSATAQVTVTITGMNDAPTALADTDGTTENAAVATDVIANDTDVDATDLLSLIGGSAAIQSMTLDADGSAIAVNTASVSQSGNAVTFDPRSDFDFLPNSETATVVIGYGVTDDDTVALTDDGTLTVTVIGENDSPVVVTNTGATLTENGTVTITGAMLNEGDVDDNGTDLTYALTALPANGTVHLNGAPVALGGTFTQDDIDNARVNYTHDDSETSSDGFDFSLADGGEDGALAATGTFALTVTPINDNAPAFTSPATESVPENTTAVQTISATDADLPAQTVNFSITGNGADDAKFQLIGGNQLSFLAAPDYENPADADTDNVYQVEIAADDGNGLRTTQTVLVTVNDAFHAVHVLNEHRRGALSLSGHASMTVGKVIVNSDSSKAIRASGNAMIDALSVEAVGSAHVTGNASINPAPTRIAAPVPDPLAAMPEPAITGPDHGSFICWGNQSHTLNPGIYSRIWAAGSCHVTLNPGTYIVRGGGVIAVRHAGISGSEVTLYNTSNDQGRFGRIFLAGDGSFDLTPPKSDDQAGIVLFQDRDNGRRITLHGSSSLAGIDGTVYAPKAKMTISGHSEIEANLIVGRLRLRGAASSSLVATDDLTSNGSEFVTEGQLLAGEVVVTLNDENGDTTAGQNARLQDALDVLNVALDPYGVELAVAASGEEEYADVQINIASTSACGDASDGVLGCTETTGGVTLIDGWNWYSGADEVAIGPDEYDFQTIVTHELGHALGLGHSADASSVMNVVLDSGETRRNLTADDLTFVSDHEDQAEALVAKGFAALHDHGAHVGQEYEHHGHDEQVWDAGLKDIGALHDDHAHGYGESCVFCQPSVVRESDIEKTAELFGESTLLFDPTQDDFTPPFPLNPGPVLDSLLLDFDLLPRNMDEMELPPEDEVLVGGAGSNILIGEPGQDLLVGGVGGDESELDLSSSANTTDRRMKVIDDLLGSNEETWTLQDILGGGSPAVEGGRPIPSY